ncbi:hypothetical protein LINGRAHAP2_LOCUS26768 [Linum grandiflorum]
MQIVLSFYLSGTQQSEERCEIGRVAYLEPKSSI